MEGSFPIDPSGLDTMENRDGSGSGGGGSTSRVAIFSFICHSEVIISAAACSFQDILFHFLLTTLLLFSKFPFPRVGLGYLLTLAENQDPEWLCMFNLINAELNFIEPPTVLTLLSPQHTPHRAGATKECNLPGKKLPVVQRRQQSAL